MDDRLYSILSENSSFFPDKRFWKNRYFHFNPSVILKIIRTGVLGLLFLSLCSSITRISYAFQDDGLHAVTVRVKACKRYFDKVDFCQPAENGNGILIDENGVVITAYHLTLDENSESLELWSRFEINFDSDSSPCRQSTCLAKLLATAPQSDIAFLQIDFGQPRRAAQPLPLATLSQMGIELDAELRIIGYSSGPNSDLLDAVYQIESFDRDVASIIINARLSEGLSGSPVWVERGGRATFIGIVSALTKDKTKTIVRTLDGIETIYWNDDTGEVHDSAFGKIVVTPKKAQPNGPQNVDQLEIDADIIGPPRNVGTILAYFFHEDKTPIILDDHDKFPTATNSQAVLVTELVSHQFVDHVQVPINLTGILETLEHDKVWMRLVLIDEAHHQLWSYGDWIEISRARVIPTPVPTAIATDVITPTLPPVVVEPANTPPSDASAPVDITSLTGRIAYTRQKTNGLWITEIICLQSEHPCRSLENMRQPDFDAAGRLLVHGAGGGKDTIMRMDASFGQDRLLTRHPEDARAQWSPGGEQIVYESTFYGDGNSRIYVQPSNGRLDSDPTSVNFDGKDFLGAFPIFLSNGKIAYQGCDRWRSGGRDCGILTSYGQPDAVPSRITTNTNDLPTDKLGSKVLFMSDWEGNWEVYSINTDGSALSNLTNNPAIDGLATASPDNQYIAFYSNRDGFWGIYVARADGRGAVLLEQIITEDQKPWREERMSWGP
ncbi:MAG: trypsin-like peptidase domain-containing protein [Caldilineaceae bacterium]